MGEERSGHQMALHGSAKTGGLREYGMMESGDVLFLGVVGRKGEEVVMTRRY